MYWTLSPEFVLALMSAKLEPLRRFSDGRWRSATRHFPAFGVSRQLLEKLIEDGLVEELPDAIILTERGADALRNRIRMPHHTPETPTVSVVHH